MGGGGGRGRRSAIVPAVGIVTPVPGKWVSLRKQPECPTTGVVWVWVGVSVEGVLYFGIIKHESDNGIKMVERSDTGNGKHSVKRVTGSSPNCSATLLILGKMLHDALWTE